MVTDFAWKTHPNTKFLPIFNGRNYKVRPGLEPGPDGTKATALHLGRVRRILDVAKVHYSGNFTISDRFVKKKLFTGNGLAKVNTEVKLSFAPLAIQHLYKEIECEFRIGRKTTKLKIP